MDLIDDHYCFVCGSENPSGLRVRWSTIGERTVGEFDPNRVHQGWKGVVHGGILATLLDEAMTRFVWQKHGNAVTAEMTVRYHEPAPVGHPLRIIGWIDEIRGRLVTARAEIRNREDRMVASASGKTLLMKSDESNDSTPKPTTAVS